MLFSNIIEEEFEFVREFELKGTIYKEVKLKNRGCRCECGTFHTNVKEYKKKKILHSIYAHQKCVLIYHHRRFICPNCKSTHMDINPFISNEEKVSDQTICNVLDDLKKYNETFTKVAERYHLTTRGIMKLFDRYCQMERLPLPKVLCIDEIYFSRKRRKKYVLVLLNFHNRVIIDILKDRDKHTLSSYFYRIPRKERDKVDYVSIDMTDNYRDILRTFLPHATIIADSFHVMKHLVDALDDVRLRTLRRFNDNKKSDEYYLLKYRNELLYATDVDYTPKMNKHFRRYLSQDQLLSMMLSLDKELHDAYILYHMYHRFNQTEFLDLKEAENQLLEIINRFTISGISEFQALASTLFNWKTEIVNSFSIYKDRRVSNGPIEGRNSLIKKILRLANGYSNFERFRNRVIYCLNRYSTHSFKRE